VAHTDTFADELPGMAKIILAGSVKDLGPVDGQDIDDSKCCLYYPSQWLCNASPVLNAALRSMSMKVKSCEWIFFKKICWSDGSKSPWICFRYKGHILKST
jgi:hypothetical protein